MQKGTPGRLWILHATSPLDTHHTAACLAAFLTAGAVLDTAVDTAVAPAVAADAAAVDPGLLPPFAILDSRMSSIETPVLSNLST